MQGYDSVAMDVDVELCGTDQIFNALAGRTLQKRFNDKDKFVIALNLMANPKTGELMSKSKGTGVFLSSSANDMFGAIMTQPDEMIEVLFINNTRIPIEEKDKIMALGPRDAKARIAHEIVKIFYGEKAAKTAEANFINTFSKKEAPTDAEEIFVGSGTLLSEALLSTNVINSKTEFTTLVRNGAVTNLDTGEKVSDIKTLAANATYKIGKHRFLKIRIK
jgi:tyrosyl-tRNA synthetase